MPLKSVYGQGFVMVGKGTCRLDCPTQNARHNVALLRRPQVTRISAQKEEPRGVKRRGSLHLNGY